MRLSKAGNAASAAKLLRQAIALGVTSFHCSSEYETFPLFAAAWRRAELSQTDRATIIAKLASPHFGENRFSAANFRSKVDYYLTSLSIERLDVVQWLLRHDLKREEERLAILHEQAQEIADTIEALKRQGKIGACVGFPYTAPIADALIGTDFCDGLALYVNPLEREMDPFLAAAAEVGKAVVAIRPFAAGRLFAETSITAGEALDHAFSFPAVATVVVSASSPEHLGELARHAPAA
jgi:aryl-alcohol dehydrogenase-like predicted oxidoreductase